MPLKIIRNDITKMDTEAIVNTANAQVRVGSGCDEAIYKAAGYALSPCDKTDIIFAYFIENEIYDMIELDIQLEEHGLPCIIS